MTKIMQYTHSDMKSDLLSLTRNMALDSWKPDVIIAPVRGGLVPGVYLSHYYKVKLLPVNLSFYDFKYNLVNNEISSLNLHEYKNILVVDDIVDSGATIKTLIDSIGENYIFTKENTRTAVLVFNSSNSANFCPNYFGREINKYEDDVWVDFEHESWFSKTT